MPVKLLAVLHRRLARSTSSASETAIRGQIIPGFIQILIFQSTRTTLRWRLKKSWPGSGALDPAAIVETLKTSSLLLIIAMAGRKRTKQNSLHGDVAIARPRRAMFSTGFCHRQAAPLYRFTKRRDIDRNAQMRRMRICTGDRRACYNSIVQSEFAKHDAEVRRADNSVLTNQDN